MDNNKRQTITPTLTVKNAEAAIVFYQKVFGARQDGQAMRGPNGGIMHAELLFGDTRVYLNDEFPEMGAHSPQHYNGTPVSLQLVVEDVDKTYKDAITAGSKSRMEPHNAFWGDRYAYVNDPFGHGWGLCKTVEKLTPEEMLERSKKQWRQPEPARK